MTKEEKIDAIKRQIQLHLNGNSKWSERELQARNQLINYLIVQGMTRNNIKDYLIGTFGISRATAYKWIEGCFKDAIADEDEYREKAFQIQIERLSEVVQNGSERAKMQALDMLNKMLNLYKEKVEVTVDAPIEFTFG